MRQAGLIFLRPTTTTFMKHTIYIFSSFAGKDFGHDSFTKQLFSVGEQFGREKGENDKSVIFLPGA